jgi:hypothetical protein
MILYDSMTQQTKYESYIIEHPELRLFLFLAVTGSLSPRGLKNHFDGCAEDSLDIRKTSLPISLVGTNSSMFKTVST